MRADLEVKGFANTLPRRIAASATRYEVGEPLHGLGTWTSGVMSTTTFVLAAADTPVIGTHRFGGVASKNAVPFKTGTLTAHTTLASCPLPNIGRMSGRAETVASIDTASELLGIIGDVTLIDYDATGAGDGGELYTIKEVASANTSGLEIVEGDTALGKLEVVVDVRAYRNTVS